MANPMSTPASINNFSVNCVVSSSLPILISCDNTKTGSESFVLNEQEFTELKNVEDLSFNAKLIVSKPSAFASVSSTKWCTGQGEKGLVKTGPNFISMTKSELLQQLNLANVPVLDKDKTVFKSLVNGVFQSEGH